MIQEVNTKNQIADILMKFSAYLYTLSTGQVSIDDLTEKFAKYAHVIVYMKEGDIAGFAGFYCNVKKGNTAYLSLIAVDPNYRRSGIGKALINEVIKTAKESGMNVLKLEVRKQNQDAVAFYQRLGFKIADYSTEESHFMYLDVV